MPRFGAADTSAARDARTFPKNKSIEFLSIDELHINNCRCHKLLSLIHVCQSLKSNMGAREIRTMSSVHRAATLGGLTVISTSAALLTRYIIVYRKSVAQSLSPTRGTGLLRLLLLLFSLLNIKNLPFVWHVSRAARPPPLCKRASRSHKKVDFGPC